MDIGTFYTDTGVLVIGRMGSLPSPPSLVANIVLRLILCPVAVVLTWVPLRLLWRNGEFPACVYVINLWLLILLVFVNAAIWHNQDFDSWWLGYGWCDLQAYVQYAMVTVYSTSVCAIMQRLSSQVGLTRVTGLSAREKRNRLLAQSLIIFPVPLLQVIITIFVQGQRYGIAAGSGCTNEYDPTAVFLVFFILPPLLFTIAACFHTFQTYRKFRHVDSGSQAALGGTNSVALSRRQRARRKLYFMVLCILVPYTPIITAFCAVNLMEGWPWNYPSSYQFVHYAGNGIPWNSISILSNVDIGFLALNMSWIPVVSAFIAFVFFGTSKEAINVYRTYLLALGLGRVFPKLHDMYDPDRSQFGSTASTAGTQLSTMDSTSHSRKGSCVPIYPSISAATATGDAGMRAPPASSSFLRRWIRKGRSFSVAAWRGGGNDLELAPAAADQLPVVTAAAAAPVASRTPFNPGFNWFTPPTEPPAAASASPAWKPVTLAATSNQSMPTRQRLITDEEAGEEEDAGPISPLPPTSSASTAGTGITTASTAPMLAPRGQESRSHHHHLHQHRRVLPLATATAPFDGTRTNSLGGRAVSTHVWSDGSPQPSASSLSPSGDNDNNKVASSSDVSGRGRGGYNSDDNVDGDGGREQQQQQCVRVDRCITTSEVIR